MLSRPRIPPAGPLSGVGEAWPTFVGSATMLPRPTKCLPVSVQREKMNGVDAEPWSSWRNPI
jgi:hypothetical protein